MTQQIVTLDDGNLITVSDLKGNPLYIPTRVVELLVDQFIEEVWLRNAGPNANGLVAFRQSTPLFLDDDFQDLVDFEEIPIANGRLGAPAIAVGYRKALGIRVTKTMIDENQMNAVQTQIIQLVNTFIRSRARALRALLTDPSIPTIAAGAAWDTSGGKPRRDIANAVEKIASQTVSGSTGTEDEFGFAADTVSMSTSMTPILLDNDNFLSIYKDKDAFSAEDIRYKGVLPRDIMGLLGATARYWPKDKVLVGQRKVAGFFSDTRPMQVTELYPEGNGPNGGPNESYRSDASGKRVMGLDQPKALCWITAVVTP